MSKIEEQLKSMKITVENVLIVGILVSSIDVHELSPSVDAIKTISEDSINLDRVSTRNIEEVE